MTAAEPVSDDDRFDWLRLIRSDGIGPQTFFALMGRFGSARAIIEALPDLLASRRGGRRIRLSAVADIEAEWEAAARLGIQFLTQADPDYPTTPICYCRPAPGSRHHRRPRPAGSVQYCYCWCTGMPRCLVGGLPSRLRVT